ncbi:MAG: hypothetical protein LQ338_005740 [Usnochroma carphineum]|nr:MAG: hypothetical protein LQ338_005740 [Usnochroma carphineum]
MEKLPPELVLRIIEYLADDLGSLKSLRLAVKQFSAATTKYLYKDLILYNTHASWKKFSAVVKHEEYSNFVKTIESSSRHDETCLFYHYARCDHKFCHRTPGYLNRCSEFRGSRGSINLKLTGFRHICGRKLEQVKIFGNIGRLELDFSLLIEEEDDELVTFFSRPPPDVAEWWVTLRGVRDLTLIQRPTLHGTDNLPFLVNFLWVLTQIGWSSLEKLTLKHTATSRMSFERFIRQQSKTLKSLRVIEPVIAPDDWIAIKSQLKEMAPKLEHLHCTEPYVPNHAERTPQEWYDRAIYIIFPIEEACRGAVQGSMAHPSGG